MLSKISLLLLTVVVARAASPDPTDLVLEKKFNGTVHPFLETYCVSCHGKDKPEAELDLSTYSTMAKVVAGSEHWDLVLDRLAAGEMPSDKAKKFPTDELRGEVVAWIQAMRKNEVAKNANDPGPVLARRLSSAEYDYTIRDLTGVDIRPTKEFPVDPANQAGFANSGESLTMSSTLLKKYLGAARTVSEHLVLKPEGFAFAPHPVLADTDRDKYAVLRIVDFYRRQPTDYANYFFAAWRYQNRVALGRPLATLADIAAENKVSAKYLTTIWSTLTATKEDVGPIAKLQTMWRELPAGGPAGADTARAGCDQMREFVTHLREMVVPEVKNLNANQTGIQNGSQTLVLWKDRQMAANRRRFDPTALHVEGAPASDETVAAAPATAKPAVGADGVVADVKPAEVKPADAKPAAAKPAAVDLDKVAAGASAQVATARGSRGGAPGQQPPRPPTPRYRGNFIAPTIVTTGSSATFQMVASHKRGTNPDLAVPADATARARIEAAFGRFAEVFPDAFYITERARVYMDAEKEQSLSGRLLSAGLHSMTGYFRDDGPLYDLVLDDAGRRELDSLWREFDFSASVPQRMHTSFVWFERTDSNYMRDPEFNPYRPEDKSVTSQAKIAQLAEIYLAKAKRLGASEAVQAAIKEHFEIVAANILRVEQDRIAAAPSHLKALLTFAERAYRRPLTPGERDGLLAFYRASRVDNGLDHEDAMRDCIATVLMSPNFCYRIDLVEAAGSGKTASLP